MYLVDDDEEDAFLFEMAIHEIIPYCRLRIFYNGLILLEVLADPAAKPHLIFLDMHMPYPDGLEVLMNLKINRQWADIPVIMLTGVDDTDKISLAYQLGAQSVINKPDSHSKLLDIVMNIREYWFKTVRLPGHASLE
ncbi:response regulator [Spirosoma sp. HMF3257]|uniref:Response regulator n=1 Tax=Spirosoma telluris TaxID=2183553 RepID=A0A327NVP1_9BACT|nr:response regulator [Spirosoma telluris]RAI78745.1 response regulator [Spirosoma telluris]